MNLPKTRSAIEVAGDDTVTNEVLDSEGMKQLSVELETCIVEPKLLVDSLNLRSEQEETLRKIIEFLRGE